ncbi:MAG: type I-U CRISPR-associated protein Cas5/Cas6 [Thermoanaerobaculaceae bacterium]|nr:type I-U CRISPR-associated protein Cas5/Cas6 [Thermoanaerobaculaceae bacterium]
MFALGIRYLMGWAMAAADGAKKEQAEWPPHPDRVFMALAAAWFETGQDEAEGEALRWLEAQDPPGIAASDAFDRQVFNGIGPAISYVPVNDSRVGRLPVGSDPVKLKEAGLSLLPEFRPRQPRSFPLAIPIDPVVHLVWQSADSGEHRVALLSLARKATSLGHPASLVQIWVADSAPKVSWEPVQGIATQRLRVPTQGRLAYLERRYNRAAVIAHAELQAALKGATGRNKALLRAELEKRFPGGTPVSLRPGPGRWQGYGTPEPPRREAPGSVFDPCLVVLALSGKRLGLTSTLRLTEALRGALLAECAEPIPEWVSGHTPDGAATTRPHLALLPLPFAGSRHADGRLMGVAVALPRQLDPVEASRVLEPWLWTPEGAPRTLRLFDGQWLECQATLETREARPWSLDVERWVRPSRCWATVTPVVLDRHFDGPRKWDRAAETVADACERIGLPRPSEVLLHPVSLVEGVPRSSNFQPITRKNNGGRMHHTHAVIVFDSPVTGPVAVGAGRFRGYGLCLPMDREAGGE